MTAPGAPAARRSRVACTACDPTGLRGYCARQRCYCAHPECWAYDSWRPPPPFNPLLVEELNEKAGARLPSTPRPRT